MVSWPEGLRASWPLGLPTAAVGVSFGLLAAPVIGPGIAVAMSLLVWSGTAQFAALSILAAGGSALLAGSTALLSNTRFLPMGFAVAPSMTGTPLRRFLTGATLADASFAVAHLGGGRFDPAMIVWAAPVQYLAWVGGTIAGALGAEAIGEPERWGLDVLFPVFYLSLLLPVLFPPTDRPRRPTRRPRSPGHRPGRPVRPGHSVARRPLLAAAAAAAVTLTLTPFTPPGVPVLVAAAAALIGLLPERESATTQAGKDLSA